MEGTSFTFSLGAEITGCQREHQDLVDQWSVRDPVGGESTGTIGGFLFVFPFAFRAGTTTVGGSNTIDGHMRTLMVSTRASVGEYKIKTTGVEYGDHRC